MYKHILLPTDGSELSARVVREGMRFAKSIGARLTAFHATSAVQPSGLPGQAIVEERLKQSATQVLDAVERAASEAGVACTVLHRVSDRPWEGIIKVAMERSYDLIFMASHGRRGVNELLLGSEKVLTHSKIPVLVTG